MSWNVIVGQVLALLCEPKEGKALCELEERLKINKASINRIIERLKEKPTFATDMSTLRMGIDHASLFDQLDAMNAGNVTLEVGLIEIIALYLLKETVTPFLDPDADAMLNRVFNQVFCTLPDELYKRLQQVERLFVRSARFGKGYTNQEWTTMFELTRAMVENRICDIQYFSFSCGANKGYEIDPFYFFEHNDGLYLYARLHGTDRILTLAVERITGIARTDRRFDSPDPDELNLDQYHMTPFPFFYGRPELIKVRFREDEVRYLLERAWIRNIYARVKDQGHESEHYTCDRDGHRTHPFFLKFLCADYEGVKRWVLSFGSAAILEEPDWLKAEITREIHGIFHNYCEL